MFGSNTSIQQQQQLMQQVPLQSQQGVLGSTVQQMVQMQPSLQQQFPYVFAQPGQQQFIQTASNQNPALTLLPSQQQQQLLLQLQQQQLLQQQQQQQQQLQQNQFKMDGNIHMPQHGSFVASASQLQQQTLPSSATQASNISFINPQTQGSAQILGSQISTADAMMLQQMNNLNAQQQQQYMMQAATGGYQLNLAQQYQLQQQFQQQQQLLQQQQQQQQLQQQQQQQLLLLQAQNPLAYGYALNPQQFAQMQFQNANSNNTNPQAFYIQQQQQQQYAQLAAIQQQQQLAQQLAAQQGQLAIAQQQLQLNQNSQLVSNNNNNLNHNIIASQNIPNEINHDNINNNKVAQNNSISNFPMQTNNPINNLVTSSTVPNSVSHENNTLNGNTNSNSNETTTTTTTKHFINHPNMSLGSNGSGNTNSLVLESNNNTASTNNPLMNSLPKNCQLSTDTQSSTYNNKTENTRQMNTGSSSHSHKNQQNTMNIHPSNDLNSYSKNGTISNNSSKTTNKQSIASNIKLSHDSEPLSHTFSGNANIGNNFRNSESVFNELLKKKKIDSEEGMQKKKNKNGFDMNSPQSGKGGEIRRQKFQQNEEEDEIDGRYQQQSQSSQMLKQSKRITKEDRYYYPLGKNNNGKNIENYNIGSGKREKSYSEFQVGKIDGLKGQTREEEFSDEAKRRQSLRIMDKTKHYAQEEGNTSNGSGSNSYAASREDGDRSFTRETPRIKNNNNNNKKEVNIKSAVIKIEPICKSCGFKISKNNFITDKQLCRKCDGQQMKEKREQAAAIAAAKLAQPNTTTDFWELKLQKNKISIGDEYQATIPPYQLHESSFRETQKEYAGITLSRNEHFQKILASRVYQGTVDTNKYEQIYRKIRSQQDRFTYLDLNTLLQKYEYNLDDISEKILSKDTDLIETVKQQCNFKSNTRMTRFQMQKKFQV